MKKIVFFVLASITSNYFLAGEGQVEEEEGVVRGLAFRRQGPNFDQNLHVHEHIAENNLHTHYHGKFHRAQNQRLPFPDRVSQSFTEGALEGIESIPNVVLQTVAARATNALIDRGVRSLIDYWRPMEKEKDLALKNAKKMNEAIFIFNAYQQRLAGLTALLKQVNYLPYPQAEKQDVANQIKDEVQKIVKEQYEIFGIKLPLTHNLERLDLNVLEDLIIDDQGEEQDLPLYSAEDLEADFGPTQAQGA